MGEDAKGGLYESAWHGDRPYDQKEAIRLEKAARLVRREAERLRLNRRYDLLDAGCGVGPLRRWLDAEAFRIVGLELSPEAARIARGSYDSCEVADVERPWPVERASFDAVHAGAVLEHVVDWHAPLNQANRALRDGGLLVVSVPNLRYWKEIRRLLRGRQPHWMCEMTHLHAYTPRFLRELVSLHGFRVIGMEADRVNLPLLPSRSQWVCRVLAGLGSVLILSGGLQRRVRVEDRARAGRFPGHKQVGLRSIEVPLDDEPGRP
jgi:2-polyprenyl-3-methyl-5-hydroxy-6-metoxy-1,4-benzoquinol methylase